MTEESQWTPAVNSSALHMLLEHAVRMADRSEYTVGVASAVDLARTLKAAHANKKLDDDAVAFIWHHYRGQFA